MGRENKRRHIEKFYKHQGLKSEGHPYKNFLIFASICVAGSYFYHVKPHLFLKKVYSNLPYIFDVSYHKDLTKYCDEEEHEKILVVYGPKGIGKTAGLKEFGKELKEVGRLPISIDLTQISEHSSEKEYISFISKAIVDGFNGINETAVKKSLIKPLVSKESTPSFYIKDNGGKYHLVHVKDPIIKKALHFLIKSVKVPSTQKGKETTTLLDALEILKEGLRPILMIHEPYRWLKSEGCTNFCADNIPMIRKILFGSDNNNGATVKYSTGIILDIGDQMKLKLFKDNNHQFVRPFEFDPDIAIDEFVTKHDFFTSCQFKTLFNVFGGVGYYYADSKRLIEGGFPFNEVLRLEINSLKRQIMDEMISSDNPNISKTILLKMVSKHPELPALNHTFTQQLLRSGLLHYATGELDRVELSTGGIENAITELRKSNFKF